MTSGEKESLQLINIILKIKDYCSFRNYYRELQGPWQLAQKTNFFPSCFFLKDYSDNYTKRPSSSKYLLAALQMK